LELSLTICYISPPVPNEKGKPLYPYGEWCSG
jgi:hypothetical protein